MPRRLTETELATKAAELLQSRLPGKWRARLQLEAKKEAAGVDARCLIHSPDGTEATVILDLVRRSPAPREVLPVLRETRWGRGGAQHLVAAPFLSPSTRARLRETKLGYVDLTGNIYVSLERPGLLIEALGADRDPAPARSQRTLRGAKASRIARLLCELPPPVGIRELAAGAGADAGYVSRLLEMLEREHLIQRHGRGPVRRVNWEDLIRRWTDDYSFIEEHQISYYRWDGELNRCVKAIAGSAERNDVMYAVTGTAAARAFAVSEFIGLPVCYTALETKIVADLSHRLRPSSERLANVWLVQPRDPFIFEARWRQKGVYFAAPVQSVVDLLTGAGSHDEADTLLMHMRLDTSSWQRSSNGGRDGRA